MNKKVENALFFGIPGLIVLIIVGLFLFRTPRHISDKKEMAPVYKLVKAGNYREAVLAWQSGWCSEVKLAVNTSGSAVG